MSVVVPLAVAGVIFAAICYSLWWTTALLPVLFLFRGFFTGLLDVAIHPTREMEIVVEENGLGVVCRGTLVALP